MSQKIKGKKRRKFTTKKVVIISSFVITAIILLGVLFGYFYVKSKIYNSGTPRVNNNDVQYTEVKGITNILLIGTDSRSLDKLSRADSIIIATLDNNNKKVKLTSLFRDTLVDIPGHGESKINAALLKGGPELLMDTIQQTYNIKLDKYVIINFWGFEAVVDQIGGLEIDVEESQLEELNKYIGESTGGNDSPVIQSGLQVLNGKQALSYARIRYNVGDDYGRTERQREVIFKIAEKLKSTKPTKYLGIMNGMLKYISTNIDPIEALNMAYTIYKFPELATEQLQMPVTELSESRLYKDLGSVILIDKEQNAQILNRFIFEDKIPNPDEYDYDSLSAKLAAYAADESSYNSIYGINPEEYETVDEDNSVINEDIDTTTEIETPEKEETTGEEEKTDEPETPVKEDKPDKEDNSVEEDASEEETPVEEDKPDNQEDEDSNNPTPPTTEDPSGESSGDSNGSNGQSDTSTENINQ